MRVVDTSAWIEYLIESPLGSKVARELPRRDAWLVPTIVQLELAKWLTRRLGVEAAETVIAFYDTCEIADLNTKTALAAADLSARHRLATADAIIYATAQAYGADVLTCDRHFESLPGVRFIPKHDA
ncbi:MAG: type II toxin-antitoxin system VapC family toxin [Acetobacteraceae bacterium]|nr:type II toxin-antitoxin system VapC family toxin [Acetobacteraceae bacterium]